MESYSKEDSGKSNFTKDYGIIVKINEGMEGSTKGLM